MSSIALSIKPKAAASADMFSITTREDPAGHVVIMGKATRTRATTFLNIPLCQATKSRLEKRLVGSLAMGTGALLEWALAELTRQGITVKARVES
jgi:hypothetical protein